MHHLVIVGDGRIGSLLVDLAARAGVSAHVVTRTHGDDALGDPRGPIVVATRNDDLPAVLARVPAANHRELVFVQNGILAPWLRDHALTGCTEGVLYVAVAQRGDTPKAGGDSVFFGPWAQDLVDLFGAGGLPARVAADRADYDRVAGEKFLWITIFGVLCQALDMTVGEVARDHADAVRALVAEAAPVVQAQGTGVIDPAAAAEALLAYSARIPHFRSGLREFKWRNGWLLRAASKMQHPMPKHQSWLGKVPTVVE